MRILLIRKGALGDVLLTTPITRRLKGEGHSIDIATESPNAYLNNKDVGRVVNTRVIKFLEPYDKIYNLDLAYENRPKMHIIDAYSIVVFNDTNTAHEIIFEVSPLARGKAKALIGENYIAIHMSRSWENRTWPIEKWKTLLSLLQTRRIVVVGGPNDFDLSNYPSATSTVGALPFEETCAVIGQAKAFVGMDSGLLHVAQALKVPTVGIFTCAKAGYRTTGALSVVPDIDCYGCLHDEKPPVTYCGCRRGDFKCLDLITPEMVVTKLEEII